MRQIDHFMPTASPVASRTHKVWNPSTGEVQAEVALGDAALLDRTERYDGVRPEAIRVPEAALDRARGADHVINYKDTPEWGRAAFEMTGGRGVDEVVEIGGPGSMAQSIQACRVGGHISLIGVLTGVSGEVPTAAFFSKNLTMPLTPLDMSASWQPPPLGLPRRLSLVILVSTELMNFTGTFSSMSMAKFSSFI